MLFRKISVREVGASDETATLVVEVSGSTARKIKLTRSLMLPHSSSSEYWCYGLSHWPTPFIYAKAFHWSSEQLGKVIPHFAVVPEKRAVELLNEAGFTEIIPFNKALMFSGWMAIKTWSESHSITTRLHPDRIKLAGWVQEFTSGEWSRTLGCKKVCVLWKYRQDRSTSHHHRLNDRPNPCAALMNVESRYNDGQSFGKMVINGERSD